MSPIADDLKLIEQALKRMRRLGRSYKYGGMKDVADHAADGLEALGRVRESIKGRQLGLWEEVPRRAKEVIHG